MFNDFYIYKYNPAPLTAVEFIKLELLIDASLAYILAIPPSDSIGNFLKKLS